MADLFSSEVAEYGAEGMILRSAAARYVVWSVLFVVVAVPALICWRKRVWGPIAKVVGLASLTIPLIVLPGLVMERVEIGPTTMVVTTGVWFSPTRQTIAVEGLLAMTAHGYGDQSPRLEARGPVVGLPLWAEFYPFAETA